MKPARLSSNETEAANRAEACALLIRAHYRVYRPEADVSGEDLVVRTPDGELRAVQLKSRLTVDDVRYGGNKSIWMLFPASAFDRNVRRAWFLVPHSDLFEEIKKKHGHTPKWNDTWSVSTVSKEQRAFLKKYQITLDSEDVDKS